MSLNKQICWLTYLLQNAQLLFSYNPISWPTALHSKHDRKIPAGLAPLSSAADSPVSYIPECFYFPLCADLSG